MKEIRRKLVRKLSGRPLAILIYILLRLLRLTMRIRVIGNEIITDFTRRGEGFIGIFWHGRLLMIPFVYPGKRMHVLIGSHRDGQLIADVMDCFGFGLVRGSSSRGGREAYREMLQLLKEDNDVAITPDGPRGPAEQLKPGIAHVARMSGRAVVPVVFSASPCLRCTSWDRFLIPYPFSRGVFVIGEPLRFQEGEDMESFRSRIENALKDATTRADEYVGTGSQGPGTGKA